MPEVKVTELTEHDVRHKIGRLRAELRDSLQTRTPQEIAEDLAMYLFLRDGTHADVDELIASALEPEEPADD
ncbi:hypothetical protein [Prauserella endophytica]|uniref:Antitoxin VbhA domain-containing protein n=1 Tax=Prauserella endophytica TaxID=1592324 RepID=A0ABY2S0G9_9PSEU|nr:hypothetical protein [Prauserella endophytica]TKG67044.1 hypothetical protein FCN18_24370 [Prauserella endophytica]